MNQLTLILAAATLLGVVASCISLLIQFEIPLTANIIRNKANVKPFNCVTCFAFWMGFFLSGAIVLDYWMHGGSDCTVFFLIAAAPISSMSAQVIRKFIVQ